MINGISNCSVCYEALDGNDPKTIPHCGEGKKHRIHASCMEEWRNTCLAAKRIFDCPICRVDLSPSAVLKMMAELNEVDGIRALLDQNRAISLEDLGKALVAAARKGSQDVVKLFIGNNDVMIPEEYQDEALLRALIHRRFAVIEILKEHFKTRIESHRLRA